jgi:SAM-dependent methyltransferase
MARDALLANVDRYYTGKVEEHGPTPRGVDWNGEASQELRFAQLLELCRGERVFSLNDYGCGYGALVGYLARVGLEADYRGFDISTAMVDHARAAHPGMRFVTREEDLEPSDFTVASGIFNVKLDTAFEFWTDYVLETIEHLDHLSLRGFAFNVLTSYSDPELMRDDLYYADPAFLFDHCKRRYSRHVALLHDYGLYEFTILVRREART